MENNIEFKDFSQSITTEEFMAVLQISTAMYENFERALKTRQEKIIETDDNLEKMSKELGQYDPQLRNMRRSRETLESVLDEKIYTRFKVYINNYDGIIEFLERFSICGTIKKRNVEQFKRKRDVEKVSK